MEFPANLYIFCADFSAAEKSLVTVDQTILLQAQRSFSMEAKRQQPIVAEIPDGQYQKTRHRDKASDLYPGSVSKGIVKQEDREKPSA